MKILDRFKRYKVCAYCGTKLFWYYIWNQEIGVLYTDSKLGFTIRLRPCNCRTIKRDGNCCYPISNFDIIKSSFQI